MNLSHGALGVALVLVALLAGEIATSLVVSVAAWVAGPHLATWAPRARTWLYFALRVAPAVVALALVCIVVLPSYFAYEPAGGAELASPAFLMLTAVSAGLLIHAVMYGVRRLISTRLLRANWEARSIPAPMLSARSGIPTFRFAHPFPVVAVVGVMQPVLFVAESVIDALTDDELSAALAHERGHLVARDNLCRLVMSCATGGLGLRRAGRWLETRWTEAAESAADEYVVHTEDSSAALALASALVKIARLVPKGMTSALAPSLPMGAFLLGAAVRTHHQSSGVTARVTQLVRGEAGCRRPPFAPVAWVVLGSALAALLSLSAAASQRRVQMTAHAAAERLVHAFLDANVPSAPRSGTALAGRR